MPKPKRSNAATLSSVKFTAAYKTARLLVWTLGTLVLISSGILTALMCGIFHLNPLMAFLGSVVGSLILFIRPPIIKLVYRSKLTQACEQEGYWDLADQLVFEDANPLYEDILSGKRVDPDKVQLSAVPLSQAQLLLIRRGEMRKALKIAEQLSRGHADNESGTYSDNMVGILYVTLGRYNEGLSILRASMNRLEATNRQNSPAFTSVVLGFLQTYVEQHNVAEAKKFLEKLKGSVDEDKKNETKSDNIVRMECNVDEVDRAWHWFFSGQIKMRAGEAGAEEAFLKAKEIMSKPAHLKLLSLFYPEILLNLAMLSLMQNDYRKAETLAKTGIDYYEKETRYRGCDYHRTIIVYEYARFRQGIKGDTIARLETSLAQFKAELEPTHPHFIDCYKYLGEAYAHEDNPQKARECLEAAERIAVSNYPAGDEDTLAIRNLIAGLPVAA
jgi:tetratricopeptide (TPR) repeat protein